MSRLALLAGLALAAAAPAAAKTLPKVPPALNPAKAYILVEYKLLKNPYAAGLPGSRKTMPLKSGLVFARYDPALGDIRGMGKARSNPVAPGEQAGEGFRSKPLAKGPGSRLFLIEVEPDTWVVQGFGGTSFSLGSYTFNLAPGSVTDLGVVEAEPDWAEGQDPPDMGSLLKSAFAGPFGKSPDIAPMRAVFRPRAAGDIPIPAGIPADRVRPVEFAPGAKFGNYLGGLVNKIEGVNASLRKPHWTSSTNR
ncbi:MAG TPA: hypothetical protein VFQ67_14335 [Allosphingosinicella sp.]|jgi:hypothetical protein|nr:hypothetical protein [Allosphingosinicella sp.]